MRKQRSIKRRQEINGRGVFRRKPKKGLKEKCRKRSREKREEREK